MNSDELQQTRDDDVTMSDHTHPRMAREREGVWAEALERREAIPMCPACGERSSIRRPIVLMEVYRYFYWRPYRCPQGHHFMIPVPSGEL